VPLRITVELSRATSLVAGLIEESDRGASSMRLTVEKRRARPRCQPVTVHRRSKPL
jgi:hypothetical protein